MSGEGTWVDNPVIKLLSIVQGAVSSISTAIVAGKVRLSIDNS